MSFRKGNSSSCQVTGVHMVKTGLTEPCIAGGRHSLARAVPLSNSEGNLGGKEIFGNDIYLHFWLILHGIN